MPRDNAETWLGWTGLGLGVIITYAAWKNVSLFGKDGLIGRALSTGVIPSVEKLPKKSSGTGSGTGPSLPIVPGLPGIPLPGSSVVPPSNNPVRPA